MVTFQMVRSTSEDDKIAAFGGSDKLVVERRDGRVAVFVGERDAAVAHLQAGVHAPPREANSGVGRDR